MEHSNSGIIPRAFSYIIDKLIFSILLLLPIVLLVKSLDFTNNTGYTTVTILATYILISIISISTLKLIYTVFFTTKFGGTLGQLLWGLKVYDQESNQLIDFKTAFLRSTAGRLFSTAFFWFGYLAIIKSSENLAWHDELFNTKVVSVRKPTIGIVSLLVFIVMLVIISIVLGTSIVKLIEPVAATFFQI